MTKASLSRCDSYSNKSLKQIITDGLSQIGFNAKTFENARVLLKPNLLMPSDQDRAIVTHPEFFRAVAQIVKENGGIPILAESPAVSSLEKTIKKAGYADIIAEEGVEIADASDTKVLFLEGSGKIKRFEISRAFFDADIIVNLPKFKTHGITYITGAVKNLFGAIPGLNKAKWHMKLPSPDDFSEFLLDLNEAFLHGFDTPKTMLHIMDAVVGQEGEGPGVSGTPREIGAIVISRDPVAADYVAVNVVGLDVSKVRTITSAFQRDDWVSSPEEIEIVGETVDSMKISDFVPTKHSIFSGAMRGPVISRTLRNLLTEKPFPIKEKCTLCYQCKIICPAEAISVSKGKKKVPAYDYDTCIRCYCCMEICPEGAIALKKGKLQLRWPFN